MLKAKVNDNGSYDIFEVQTLQNLDGNDVEVLVVYEISPVQKSDVEVMIASHQSEMQKYQSILDAVKVAETIIQK